MSESKDEKEGFLQKIGEGSYGKVYKTYSAKHKKYIAIKYFGRSVELAKKEYHILSELKHDNIVMVYSLDIIENIAIMNMELMDLTLQSLLFDARRNKKPFHESETKAMLYFILNGLNECHSKDIVHCDIKPENILISEKSVKICDFGLAGKNGSRSNKEVVSRWYKPLEVVFEAKKIKTSIDIWSLGCIFYEMLTNEILFHSANNYEQGYLIISRMGVPTDDECESMGFKKGSIKKEIEIILPNVTFDPYQVKVKDKIALDLLSSMLQYNPSKRITAEEALMHPYFNNYHINMVI